MFNSGDKVVATRNGASSRFNYRKGDVGTVENVNCDTGEIDVRFIGNFIRSCDDDNFILIKEEPMNTFKKSDLKTGMMVQFSDKSWNLVLASSLLYGGSNIMFLDFSGEYWQIGSYYNDNLEYTGNNNLIITNIATCDEFKIDIINAFVNHSDPTAIPGFHIIWSRESDEKAKVISVIEGLQKELDDAKRKLEELG
jgi:hypothetical protein